MRLLFFGSTEFAVPCLVSTLQGEQELIGVVSVRETRQVTRAPNPVCCGYRDC